MEKKQILESEIKKNSWESNSVLSVAQMTDSAIQELFALTDKLKSVGRSQLRQWNPLSGYLLSNLFFEASTRSRISFASAFQSLGGNVDNTVGVVFSSISKGESLSDTIRVVQGYVDVIVLRHFTVGSARVAANNSTVPIINAGDGIGEHPTQALLDLYTIYSETQRLSNLTIAIVGDLQNGRTVHSLVNLMGMYQQIHIVAVAPHELQLPDSSVQALRDQGVRVTQTSDFHKGIAEADVIYMTRLQRERFQSESDYERFEQLYILNRQLVESRCKPTVVIMHPLPRTSEISTDVDACQQASYFRQTDNGLYVRMALFLLVLLSPSELRNQLKKV
ncbi:MAG: aspartate carbamoyltransferase [Candidatus Marinamargulisbacteria bacterium]|nr:aspartate carbamoyltransferase [Candidatus Marinamargulisbacteria bacterium]|tara:strand:- start:8505 stop:9509 length:1005 start_codon:yes stop_codon:yes gene_type:complete